MAVSGHGRSSSTRWLQTAVSVAFCVRHMSACGTDCVYTVLRSRVSWTTSKHAQLITRRCLECIYALHCRDIYLLWITYAETYCKLTSISFSESNSRETSPCWQKTSKNKTTFNYHANFMQVSHLRQAFHCQLCIFHNSCTTFKNITDDNNRPAPAGRNRVSDYS